MKRPSPRPFPTSPKARREGSGQRRAGGGGGGGGGRGSVVVEVGDERRLARELVHLGKELEEANATALARSHERVKELEAELASAKVGLETAEAEKSAALVLAAKRSEVVRSGGKKVGRGVTLNPKLKTHVFQPRERSKHSH